MKTHRSTYCNANRFKWQMWFLHFFRYTILSLNDLLPVLTGQKPTPLRGVILTFDDGYCNFYSHAYPILQKYRFPATVYVLSSLMGKRAIWFERDGRDAPPLLDKKQIQSLSLKGINIGSHGKTHVRLGELPPEKAWEEIAGSKKRLEKELGIPMRDFCYPYGSMNQQVRDMVEKAGYRTAVSCIRGAVRPGCDPYILPRKAISYGDNIIGMWWKLHFKNKPKYK